MISRERLKEIKKEVNKYKKSGYALYLPEKYLIELFDELTLKQKILVEQRLGIKKAAKLGHNHKITMEKSKNCAACLCGELLKEIDKSVNEETTVDELELQGKVFRSVAIKFVNDRALFNELWGCLAIGILEEVCITDIRTLGLIMTSMHSAYFERKD